ncbi:MAG: VWA domain-containing protein, partial [Vicinamibacteria bacterium]
MAFPNSKAEARPRIPLWVIIMTLALLSWWRFGTVRAQKAPVVFGSEIALVQVPVFVSRSDGSAVLGLTEADFVVEQDGKRVPVVSFRSVDTTLPGDSQEAIKQSSAARRRFLLLFDKSFTDLAGLARARKAAKEFVLHDLADSDLAAVATFDFLRGVRLVANFTEDRRVLEHAIHTLGIPSLSKISDPLAIAADFQSTDLVRDHALSSAETPQELMTQVLSVLVRQMQSAEQQAYRARVETLLQGLRGLGASLQRIPGRKQILYFSTGFNSTLLAGQDTNEQKRMSEAIAKGRIWEVDASERYGDSAFRGEVDEALLAFTRSDSVIHSIDLSGLGSSENYAQLPVEAQPSRDASGRDSLALIAAETGGRFFKDANDLRPVLREMADMTSRYYVLGVQPRDAKADGRFRKLRVSVKARGLRVSHRPGFFERSEAPQAVTALERQFEAAELLIGRTAGAASPLNQVPFRVLIIPVPANDVNQSLGIVVQVPGTSMGSGEGALELFGYAIARSGAISDHLAHFIRLDASDNSGSGATSGVSFSGRFDVPPGDYTLKFLVQRASGEASTRYFDVTVPKRQ